MATTNHEKKNLIKNIISLGSLQAVDYLIPILLIPYLLRVIGIENYGILAFSSSVVIYFSLLTDYGFNLSATRLVSLNRDNTEKLKEIFSAVLIVKIALFFIGLILITILIYSFDKIGKHSDIVYLTFAMILGQALFPLWLFQGLEKMGYITLINSTSKIIFASLIFIFVQDENDVWIVPFLTSTGFIVAGIFGILTATIVLGVQFKLISVNTLKYYLIDGKHAFLANAGGALYRNSNILILGILTTPTLVGYYAVAEKVIQIIQRFQGIIGNALYPFLNNKIKSNENYFFAFNQKFKLYIILAYLIASIILVIAAPFIVSVLTGNEDSQATFLIQIMSVVVLIGGMSYYYGILGLMTMNYKKSFSIFILSTGVFNLITCTLLTYNYNEIGTALSLVLSETFLLILILNKFKKIKATSI